MSSERALPDGVLSGTVISHSDAVQHKARVQDNVQDRYVLFIEGLEAGHWRTLSYPNPAAWWRDLTSFETVAPEIRQQLVLALRKQGFSLRAIGDQLGTTKDTAQRDLDQLSHGETVDDLPERITGLDGRDRPATRPAEEKQAQRDDRKRDIELDRQAKERMAAALAAAELTAKAKEIRQHLPVGDSLGQMLGAATDMQWQLEKSEHAGLAASAKAVERQVAAVAAANAEREKRRTRAATATAGIITIYLSGDDGAVVEVGAWRAAGGELSGKARKEALTRAIAALQLELLKSYA